MEINFGKVNLSKPTVLCAGKGRGFLASLAAELKKLASNSSCLSGKFEGERRRSVTSPEADGTGEKAKLAEGQLLQPQGIPNYAAPLAIVTELRGKGEIEPNIGIGSGSTAEHSETSASDRAMKTELASGIAAQAQQQESLLLSLWVEKSIPTYTSRPR